MLKSDGKEALYYQLIDTPAGPFRLIADTENLRFADFFGSSQGVNLLGNRELIPVVTPLLERAVTEFARYFQGVSHTFTVPFFYSGTIFQQQVWSELCRIPYGTTISYGELARRIGKPKAARAVGQANNRNPLAVIVPCHRVIGNKGELVGYASGLDKKAWLLALEGRHL